MTGAATSTNGCSGAWIGIGVPYPDPRSGGARLHRTVSLRVAQMRPDQRRGIPPMKKKVIDMTGHARRLLAVPFLIRSHQMAAA